jgi:hypothetical protein
MPDVEERAPWSSARRRRACFGAMLLAREMQDVVAVQRWVLNAEVLSAAAESAESAVQLAQCRTWLKEAIKHEVAHGERSLLDRTHPFWVRTLEPALRRFGRLPANAA